MGGVNIFFGKYGKIDLFRNIDNNCSRHIFVEFDLSYIIFRQGAGLYANFRKGLGKWGRKGGIRNDDGGG